MEFALLTPIVILLMVAIIDFGMAMNRRIVLQHAAREGARMAAVSDNISAGLRPHHRARRRAQSPARDITFTYQDLDEPPNGRYDAGDNVKITLPYHWDLPILNYALFGLFDSHIDPIDMTATGSARLERTVPGDWEVPMMKLGRLIHRALHPDRGQMMILFVAIFYDHDGGRRHLRRPRHVAERTPRRREGGGPGGAGGLAGPAAGSTER